ncbi:MAG: DUF1365 domain-containing protein [Hyphomicrobiaceae bacterium]
MTFNSAVYSGWVSHSRLLPRRHQFRYRVWWMLVDIDELGSLDRTLLLFSHNKFNLCALHDSDYGHGSASLRDYVEGRLSAAGLSHAGAGIQLLTMPRFCGYAFNPLSIFFCRDATGDVAAIIYEVHNTFGERHSYVIEAGDSRSGVARHTAAKAFYVSPFLDIAQNYTFRVRMPCDCVAVSISASQGAESVIHTALHGRRLSLTSAELLRRCIMHPLLTLKVIGAIHWEAFRIWIKGVAIRPHRPVSGHAATYGGRSGSSKRADG